MRYGNYLILVFFPQICQNSNPTYEVWKLILKSSAEGKIMALQSYLWGMETSTNLRSVEKSGHSNPTYEVWKPMWTGSMRIKGGYSNPTYEVWKLSLMSLLRNLILLLQSYLWGMETWRHCSVRIPPALYSNPTYEVWKLPQGKSINSFVVYSNPTYEVWKLLLKY